MVQQSPRPNGSFRGCRKRYHSLHVHERRVIRRLYTGRYCDKRLFGLSMELSASKQVSFRSSLRKITKTTVFDRKQNIINVTSSSEFNISWEELINLGKDIIYNDTPFNGVVWYPGGSMKKSRFLHFICFYMFQIVPAVFIDALLIVLGYKPMY